jgi:hypothetical protein
MTPKQLTLLIGFLMTLSFLAGNLLHRRVLGEPVAASQAYQAANLTRWEYRLVTSSPQEFGGGSEERMNRLGDQGFEVAEFQGRFDNQGREFKYVLMKKQKK